MNHEKKDNEVLNKVIDLGLVSSIKESELYLKFLDNKIKFYQNEISFLEDNKPLFFQKKKIEEHNKKIEEYEQIITNAYLQMDEEVDMILEMQNSIKS